MNPLFTENEKSVLPRRSALKDLLEDRKITQEQLANELELSSRTVREKLRGTCPWWLAECHVVCRMLKLKFEEVFHFTYVPAHEISPKSIIRSECNHDQSKK